jgi:hypothetical protein
MKPPSQFSAVIFALMGSVVACPALYSQSERQEPHLRNHCRLAAQVLETGHPAPRYDWALESIARCDETGPPVVAALWRRPPSDVHAQERLFYPSYTLRDSRLTAAVIEAAENRSLPQLVRLNAVRVLAGHAAPEFLLSISDLLRVDSDIARYYFPSVDHVSVRNGQSPVEEGTIRDILAALQGMRNDPDPQIAQVASRTRRQLCLRLASDACP